jgi:hypothetical protein
MAHPLYLQYLLLDSMYTMRNSFEGEDLPVRQKGLAILELGENSHPQR